MTIANLKKKINKDLLHLHKICDTQIKIGQMELPHIYHVCSNSFLSFFPLKYKKKQPFNHPH